MKIDILVIVIAAIAILAFVYFIITRNRKDQKKLEDDFNEQELYVDKHKNKRI